MSSNVGDWLGTAFLAISSDELSAVLSHEHTYLSVPPARFSESACFGFFQWEAWEVRRPPTPVDHVHLAKKKKEAPPRFPRSRSMNVDFPALQTCADTRAVLTRDLDKDLPVATDSREELGSTVMNNGSRPACHDRQNETT